MLFDCETHHHTVCSYFAIKSIVRLYEAYSHTADSMANNCVYAD